MVDEVKTVTNDVKPEVTQTPSLEQRLEAAVADAKTRADEVAKANASIQGLKGSLMEKDRLLKEQTTIRDEINSLRDSQRVLASMLAEKDGISEDIDKKQDYLKKFDELEKKRTDGARQKEALDKLRETAESFQKRTEAVLTVNDPEYYEIQELVMSGSSVKVNRADAMLKKIEKSKETKVETVKPDNEKRIAELEAELKKYKGGGLNTELPVPAGVTKSDELIRSNWRANPNNPNVRKEYLEYLQRKK